MDALYFIVAALAVHRVTHLVVEDQIPIVKRPREWITDRKPDGSLAYLVGCFWCSSVWVSAAAVGAMYLWNPTGADGVPAPLAVGAALSTAAASWETLLQYLDARAIG